jgi:uncharacterized hydrophobic protein (TIGR00341 family)
MALRLIELIIPKRDLQALEELVLDRKELLDIRMHPISGIWRYPVLGVWKGRFSEDQILAKILVRAEESESLLDLLEDKFSKDDGFRINLFPVEASLPEAAINQNEEVSEEKHKAKERISREELYSDIEAAAQTTKVYMVMVILSSIVAAIGVLNNSIAVIIGAMVIAPLLGPNVALSLATTLGDLSLARNALKTNILGIALSIIISTSLGLVLFVDPSIYEISSRTSVELADIALALASGCAGVLSFTSGAPAVLIGVTVAVSLLPPLVTFGLLLGSGFVPEAMGAFLYFLLTLYASTYLG